MGTSNGVEELVGKLSKYANDIPKAGAASLVAATGVYEAGIDRRVRAATGGDRRLSGVGNAELRTASTIGPTQAAIGLVGPWVFVERDMPRHDITARGRRRRSSKGAQALYFGGEFFASAHDTGGSKASYPFEVGATESEPAAMEAFVKAHDLALAATFGGF